jgi:hypothetical protein
LVNCVAKAVRTPAATLASHRALRTLPIPPTIATMIVTRIMFHPM